MNNFGVIEVAGPKTSATPGWAYVADAAPIQQAASTSRKRAAARGQGLSLSDQSAREAAKIRKELEGLDREGSRDVVIPVPTKGRAQGKHTPNVRKILQSNKTFANHLDDFEAMQALAENNPAANQFTAREPPSKQSNASRRKQSASRASSATARSTPRPQAQKESPTSDAPPVLTPLEKEDVKMEDAPTETPRPTAKLPEGVGDVEMLLRPRVPEMPTDSELRALLAGPPLTYSQARGDWDEEDRRYPPRVFCSVCGYWGRVKCVKCGTRVCALECLDVHREECVTRYGL